MPEQCETSIKTNQTLFFVILIAVSFLFGGVFAFIVHIIFPIIDKLADGLSSTTAIAKLRSILLIILVSLLPFCLIRFTPPWFIESLANRFSPDLHKRIYKYDFFDALLSVPLYALSFFIMCGSIGSGFHFSMQYIVNEYVVIEENTATEVDNSEVLLNENTELIAALKNPYFIKRVAAVKALSQSTGQENIKYLIAALLDERYEVQSAAVYALVAINDPRAVPSLIAMLDDQNIELVAIVATGLGDIRDPRAIAPLIATLDHKHFIVSGAAEKALQSIGSLAVPALVTVSENRDAIIGRRTAIRILQVIGDERAVDSMMDILMTETNRALLDSAGETLAAIGGQTVVERLAAILMESQEFDLDVSQRCYVVANVLEKIGSPAVDVLIEALKNGSFFVQYEAARALRRIDDPRAAEALVSNELLQR